MNSLDNKAFTAIEEQHVRQAFEDLLASYLASNHRQKTDIITRAFNFACAVHQGQRRRSGEPYVLHPIAVAQIVCQEMGLGSTTICAALLHDVIEDSSYTREDLANLFGEKIANIVEGVSKVSQGLLPKGASQQAETFKKILLTMGQDLRVVLVKMADRLHNMRTLAAMPPARQHKIAGETLSIFAPLAERLGMRRVQRELEDLAFAYEYPEQAQEIAQHLVNNAQKHEKVLEQFVAGIAQMLEREACACRIKTRSKRPYSLWRKMQTQQISYEEVYDLLVVRLIFDCKSEEEAVRKAYAIYALLATHYPAHPTRFRDWLTQAKSNGYRALHNTFMTALGQWVEVQICSTQMEDVAERGLVATWQQQQGKAPYDEGELDLWIQDLKESLDSPQSNTKQLLETIRYGLFAAEILVFTPKGDSLKLPQGATVLDFAFAIHSMVGSHCVGAKVNQQLTPLSYALRNGDQVEILTASYINIQPDWLQMVTTSKARGKIGKHLHRLHKQQQERGEELLHSFAKAHQLQDYQQLLAHLQELHHCDTHEALYSALGEQKITLSRHDYETLMGSNIQTAHSWVRWLPFLGKRKKLLTPRLKTLVRNPMKFLASTDSNKPVKLTAEVLPHLDFCTQCCPLHGDEVMGCITPTQQIVVHRRHCPQAQHQKVHFGNLLLALRWDEQEYPTAQSVRIHIEGIANAQLLLQLSEIFEPNSPWELQELQWKKYDGIFQGELQVRLHTLAQLQSLLARLHCVETITAAYRCAWGEQDSVISPSS